MAHAGKLASRGTNDATSDGRSSTADTLSGNVADMAQVIARRREQLCHAIAEAAYYRAEHRGFAPGHELEDWLAAQEEIAGNS